ncbi:MAG: low specificity L-threonine aldolase [Ruminococcaceae bacterium]|nr:low specificity L-threonine aldolase [Oscillospiraceae bacterium]
MIRFECDYTEGAHPRIIERLAATNLEQTPGYGVDEYCERARGYIKEACNAPDADVHFLVGGTQANTVVIKSILRPHQGVLCAATGHINCHETGAIEAMGHKVLGIVNDDGKLRAEQIRKAYDDHWNDATHEHIVQPGMVYISHPTENGTTYTKSELTAISQVCRELGLPLFMDGARMGYGVMAQGADLTLADIANLCDVFYIGGTKVGALFGEAVVITKPELKKDFRYFIKQHGGMLAKGRLLGIQFDVLFEDGLYFEISKHAVEQAMRIRSAFAAKGVKMRYDSMTNQQFPILSDEVLAKLGEKYAYSFWEKMDDTTSAVRFCTSWATKTEAVDELLADIDRVL